MNTVREVFAWFQAVDWPAWVQALGSLLALWVATRIARSQLKLTQTAEHQRSQAYLSAATYAVEVAISAVASADRAFGGNTVRDFAAARTDNSWMLLETAEVALSSLPLHEAPGAEVVEHILNARTATRRVGGCLENHAELDSRTVAEDFSGELEMLQRSCRGLWALRRG